MMWINLAWMFFKEQIIALAKKAWAKLKLWIDANRE